ncbi:MAG: DUF975 family protein [Tenericutes bacterium]|jgi:hypothetical protein|nr:DUF975 family protein [Mycoplasmatota bacterium]
MRLIYAFKHLIKNYKHIMPTYILSVLGLLIVSHLAPVIGTILILPISIGVARVMINAAEEEINMMKLPIFLGFKPKFYIKNLIFLGLRQILIYLPLAIGALVSVYVFDIFNELEFDISVAIGNIVVFALPAAIISLMFAMVPYLIADERFDQRKHNPLKVSIKIMHGNYIRLILVRLLFAPWIALQSSGIIYLLLTYYNKLFGGNPPQGFLRPAFFITPLVILFIMPWYQMVHAELYAKLRHKVSDYY